MKKFFCLLLAVCFIMLAGCGGQREEKAVTVRVAVAASLEKVFTQRLIPLYQKKHPEIKIEGVYDASGKLQAQIENGLQADIFISASDKQMQALTQKGYMETSSVQPLLENKLVLIVPAQQESVITSFADLPLAKRPAIGDPASVPAGQYAQEALTRLGLWQQVQSRASLGTNVTQVLQWVAEGSADAGLVYATDAAILKDQVKTAAEAPQGSLQKPIIYPVGRLKASSAAAEELEKFLLSDEAQQIFKEYGFTRAR